MNEENSALKSRLHKNMPKSKVIRNSNQMIKRGGGDPGVATFSVRICMVGGNSYASYSK